jgi:syntaxin-binding protein 1
MQYVVHRDGIFPPDLEKLLAHSQLPTNEGDMIANLEMLGAKVSRQIKDPRPATKPLFPPKPPQSKSQEDLSISRWEPSLKEMIEQQVKGTLDQDIFPYTKPQLDANDALDNQMQMSQSSLRSAKPTWARAQRSGGAPRQRMIIFLAGGATYSESRVCYEISQQYNKDVYLSTSHMLTPRLFLKQLSDLSVDRRRLDLPADRAPRRAPAHILNQPKPAPPGGAPEPPPSAGMANMSINSTDPRPGRSSGGGGPPMRQPRSNGGPPPPAQPAPIAQGNKLTKDKGEKKEKKGFFKF